MPHPHPCEIPLHPGRARSLSLARQASISSARAASLSALRDHQSLVGGPLAQAQRTAQRDPGCGQKKRARTAEPGHALPVTGRSALLRMGSYPGGG
jgi:hypothetical protein